MSEKLQALWVAHVPFHLALPLFPTDSDALAALVLVGGVAMLSMLLASSRGQQFFEWAAMNTYSYIQLRASEGSCRWRALLVLEQRFPWLFRGILFSRVH